MKTVILGNRIRKTLRGNSRGVTLIEVLIALVLLGIIAITFANALGTASKAVVTADVRTNAESLARTQMEYVKNQAYNSTTDEGEATYLKITVPDLYAICSVHRNGATDNCGNSDPIIAVSWNSQNNTASNDDTGLQKITLVIKHEGREVITMEGYKIDR